MTQANGEAHSIYIGEEPCVPPWVVLYSLFQVVQLETCPVCPQKSGKKADNEPFTKHSLGACGQQSTESPCSIGRNPTSATTLYICLGGLDQLQGPNSKSKMKVLLVLDFKLKDLD